jgi:uncharacterized repeat protein (TIGR01451 family)
MPLRLTPPPAGGPSQVPPAVSYSFLVRNPRPQEAVGVVLDDPRPAGVGYRAHSTTAGAWATPAMGSSGPVSCAPGTLAPGASVTVTLEVAPAGSGRGPLAHTATGTSATLDPQPGNDPAAPLVKRTGAGRAGR